MKRRILWMHVGSVALAAMLAVAHSQEAEAATVNMSWTAPTQCTDGTPIANCALTGYDALCVGVVPTGGANTACGTPLRNVSSPTALTFTYDVGTPPAQGAVYSFAIRAKSAGGDSANSNTATKTFANRVPNQPTGLTVAQLLEMDDAAFMAYLNEPPTILVDVFIKDRTYYAGPRGSTRIKQTIKEIVRFETVASL